MKKRRVITRNPFSIEDGLKDVIDKIGSKGLKEATGKGKDTFKKMSNPMHPGRHITVKDAVDIDIYCRQKGLGSPLMDCYKTMIENITGTAAEKTPDKIHKSLLQIVEELGDVSEETRTALEDGHVTDKEREKIAKEVKEVEVLMSDLKQKLELGKKHDYKYKSGEKIKNRDEDGLKD